MAAAVGLVLLVGTGVAGHAVVVGCVHAAGQLVLLGLAGMWLGFGALGSGGLGFGVLGFGGLGFGVLGCVGVVGGHCGVGMRVEYPL